MVSRRLFLACVAAATVSLSGLTASAANEPYTTIQVTDMHCSACAKKIAAKLYIIPGVLEVRADVKKNLAYVVPSKKRNPSPKAMWEAVEAAGFKLVNLKGPSGEFVKKPQQ